MNWLSRLFARAARAQGCVYIADEEDGPMKSAVVGAVVRTPSREAPWIVVDKTLNSVVVARWPGRLWKVEIVEALQSDDLRPDAGYTRASAVRALEELPAHLLFGAHGTALVPVFDAARTLTRAQAEQLAAARDTRATAAKNRLWQRWLEQTHPTSPHRGQDLGEVLALMAHKTRSPVGSALTVLHQLVFERAVTVDGDAATERDDDDLFLLPPWSEAVTTLCDAALALGAPDSASDEDRAILQVEWHAVFGAV